MTRHWPLLLALTAVCSCNWIRPASPVRETAQLNPESRISGTRAADTRAGVRAFDDIPELFNTAEWKRVQRLTPQPDPPESPTNAYADSKEAAHLGQLLFFDSRYSGPLISRSDLGRVGERGKVSCASCHMPEHWFIDARSIPAHGSRGVDHFRHRNAPTLVNVSYYRWSQWDGLFDSLWSQMTVTPEHPEIMGSNRMRVAKHIERHYAREYAAAFGPLPDLSSYPDDATPAYSARVVVGKQTDLLPAWNALSEIQRLQIDTIHANYAKALEAYLRLLTSGPSPFDHYAAGDFDAISESAQRGLRLFVGKAACQECHDGPMLSNASWTGDGWPNEPGFHNLGIEQDPLSIESVADKDGGQGYLLRALTSDSINIVTRFSGTSRFSDHVEYGSRKIESARAIDAKKRLGAFRVPSLRNVAETAPYMHNGYLSTLEEVVRFYNRGGHSSGFVGEKDRLMFELDLTEPEIRDLVAFLETLTGTPVEPALRQPIMR